ncbi:MAG: ORF6C domain-containing protein [Peptostreptococcaceae bacterium]|nr:ORF6C domain-containing protein [Peptostreptococcaceae bacterium]
MQAILIVDQKQQELEKKILNIEDKMTVNYELAENLRSAINIRAVELLGGKDSEAYKKLNKKLFAAFYRDIKRAFKVNSYKNLSVKNYDRAMEYIQNWEPKDEILIYAIQGLNTQLAFS